MIEVQGIRKKFGVLQALEDVSFSALPGECIALIGPNGSGKTTLIKTILGMVVPDGGDIRMHGKSILKAWDYRKEIGYMPQIGRYPDNMTIGQVLNMMRDIRGYHENDCDSELIEAFGMNTLLQKRMRTLSGGTRQKVSAIIAFLFHPSMLILDEPSAGLDPVSTELLRRKIIREKQNGKLILLTSHVLSELDDLSSSVIYMQDGSIRFRKSTRELLDITGENRLSRAVAAMMLKTSTHAENTPVYTP